VRLGIRIVDGLELRSISRRHLQELARETGDDVYLAVPLGRRVAYVDRFQGSRPVTVDIRLGQSLFLHSTSVGKLFAANDGQLRRRLFSEELPRLTEHTLVDAGPLEEELARITEQGYAVSREESIIGVVGIAVPIRAEGDTMVGAIHISALNSRMTPDTERELVNAAEATAAQIERALGRVHPPSRRGRLGTRAAGAAHRRTAPQSASSASSSGATPISVRTSAVWAPSRSGGMGSGVAHQLPEVPRERAASP
jgi:DNA-binding IclR family transcriptional regulator